MRVLALNAVNVGLLESSGPALSTEQDAADLIGAAYGSDIAWIAIPKARMSADFWRLDTRKLSFFTQKLATYGLNTAFVGDFSAEATQSEAFAAFMRECARGGQVAFVTDEAGRAALASR